MPAYWGAKQLFRDKCGNRSVREIYYGTKMIKGFTTASYTIDELIGEKAPAGDVPKISGNGSSLSVMTNKLNPGYAYTKYYCDHIKFVMIYSGGCVVYDYTGKEIINISGTISFNYLTAKWTLGSKCIINGTTVFDSSNTSRDMSDGRLTYEVYYDTATRKWTVEWNGGKYTGNEQEWEPTYMRVAPQIWIISSTAGVDAYNGSIAINYLNRAKGYPNAR